MSWSGASIIPFQLITLMYPCINIKQNTFPSVFIHSYKAKTKPQVSFTNKTYQKGTTRVNQIQYQHGQTISWNAHQFVDRKHHICDINPFHPEYDCSRSHTLYICSDDVHEISVCDSTMHHVL